MNPNMLLIINPWQTINLQSIFWKHVHPELAINYNKSHLSYSYNKREQGLWYSIVGFQLLYDTLLQICFLLVLMLVLQYKYLHIIRPIDCRLSQTIPQLTGSPYNQWIILHHSKLKLKFQMHENGACFHSHIFINSTPPLFTQNSEIVTLWNFKIYVKANHTCKQIKCIANRAHPSRC
jgi:hypothetical protein